MLVLALIAAIGVALFFSARAGPEMESWSDGQVDGRWRTVFTGYGAASGNGSTVVLKPRAATVSTSTHGALVVTTDSHCDPEFEVKVRTEKQLRQGSPANPWEVGWVLWNYRDNNHFYAAALKPNGWEISKQDPAYPGNQRFLASGTAQRFPVGGEYRLHVGHTDNRTTVSVDGRELATIVDEERPYHAGAIGLYTEDARVRFTDLNILGSTDCQ
ncbi:calcium-binding protein [Kocuria rosea]|uniref:calcium-binding protein n=1 Tax=Kocuria rosea TaxID=1275 RepID=UPI00203B00D9|nr:calcium-binding protein [Kocuria rosea]MCM3687846.1 calcium-binding protein [Kocuria rosea]